MSDDARAQLAQQIHRVDWKPLAPQLTRATSAQTDVWREESGEHFMAVIVQPYVLVQRDSGVSPG
jgi:hypothetical protein